MLKSCYMKDARAKKPRAVEFIYVKRSKEANLETRKERLQGNGQ